MSLLLLGGISGLAAPAWARPKLKVVDLYETARAASIEVLVDDHLTGSGVVVSGAGLALTAAHVVGDRTGRFEGRIPGVGRLPIEIIAVDRGHDIALLRLPVRRTPYAFLSLASVVPAPPSTVYLFGAPMYRHALLLSGAVARPDRVFEYLPDEAQYIEVLQLSGAAPPGTSGGPWIDRAGHLIGLQSALIHNGGAPVGVVNVAPLEALRALIRRGTDAHTATLGVAVEEIWEQGADYLKRFPKGTEGVRIARLHQGGPAQRAGLRVDDLITAVDGAPVRLRDTLLMAIRKKRPADSIRVSVRRPESSPFEATLTLGWLEAR